MLYTVYVVIEIKYCALSWNLKLIITKMHGQQHIKINKPLLLHLVCVYIIAVNNARSNKYEFFTDSNSLKLRHQSDCFLIEKFHSYMITFININKLILIGSYA